MTDTVPVLPPDADADRIAGVFATAGIVVIDRALSADTLDAVRREAVLLKRQTDAAFALAGRTSHAGTTVDRCYSVAGRHAVRPVLCRLIADAVMARLCAAAIGPDAFLFTDQFLMKGPRSRMDFNWHQDGAYVPVAHHPFLVVWLPLDDVGLDNGTIRAIPFSRLPDRALRPHSAHPDNADLVGYWGADRGDAVVCPAGALVAFDSRLFHASDDNTSDGWRRIYQIRYTPQPIVDPVTAAPLHFAKRVFGGRDP